ncbi:hypothetical protein BRPE64_BCDS08780 [Caballeronia insecticola]|uniref:Uncharacterized protein n=1 Tax=Caballeronia insecticola TaxID=758793 RepID=R4WLZ9_9BURK|nr:hypothetical protein BRPE64_BCDS08780 [Caballeronia insecticola]
MVARERSPGAERRAHERMMMDLHRRRISRRKEKAPQAMPF